MAIRINVLREALVFVFYLLKIVYHGPCFEDSDDDVNLFTSILQCLGSLRHSLLQLLLYYPPSFSHYHGLRYGYSLQYSFEYKVN